MVHKTLLSLLVLEGTTGPYVQHKPPLRRVCLNPSTLDDGPTMGDERDPPFQSYFGRSEAIFEA